jgi:diguanylate cyclase (GGDEF)-like protein
MAAARRRPLGTRLFLSLATMLVPLVLVGAAGIASQYRNAATDAANVAEAVEEMAVVNRARDAVAGGDPDEVARALRDIPKRFDEHEEQLLITGAMRLQRAGAPADRVSAALTNVRSSIMLELNESADTSDRRADVQLAILLCLLVAGIAFAVFLARRLRREIVGPLSELNAAAERVAQEELSTRIELTCVDEIARVGHSFNAMMERLQESHSELVYQAFHDALTGLPNRTLFTDRTEQALKRTHRSRHANGRVAVLFLDLDDFKGVNDSYGHSAGDELLTTAAGRLRSTLRTEDTIARLGGDEFAVLLENVPDPEHAALAGDRLLEALAAPMTIAGRELLTDASVGIALSTGPDDTAEELLRNADVAMYAAKGAGRGRRELFAPAMHSAVFARMSLETDLRRGLEREEFRLVYQPVFELETRNVVAVEALLRWDHPERGLVAPMDFIPLAERSGLIVPLGRWVINEATRQAAVLQALPGTHEHLTMAVNLSPRQLLDRSLVADVSRALETSGIAPSTLVLELTESLLTADIEETVPVLAALKRLGVLLAIDDIGGGYSSLSYLRRFPVDVIKLDRELISGNEHDAKLARALLGLGRELELATVAEGIEHPEQLAEMRRLGCDLGQGFLFAEPMPADELVTSLSHEHARAA